MKTDSPATGQPTRPDSGDGRQPDAQPPVHRSGPQPVEADLETDAAAEAPAGLPNHLRREKRAEQRRSAQAQQTRALLMVAARRVFERIGYLDARVADIVAETGRSHGTFYTYFSSKDDIFRAVMEDALSTLYSFGVHGGGQLRRSERERIEAANQRFVAVYKQNRAIMGLFEQVATYDLEFRKMRLAIRAQWVARIELNMVRLQAQGLCRGDLDAHTVASALASMVSSQVYLWQVMGEEHEERMLVDTLSALWIAAIGLDNSA